MRHLIITDTQIRPGVKLDHLGWIAKTIVRYRPDTLVHIGDHWDMPSLSSYEDPGSVFMENQRYTKDIEVGNEAMAILCEPMEAEIKRTARTKKPWTPRLEFCFGNHEDRVTRFCKNNARFSHSFSLDDMDTRDFKRNAFGKIVDVNGVLYSHFFSNPLSGKPIGGSIPNRLNKVCQSFVQGHVQGFDYGTKMTPVGKTLHGVVAGSAYTHIEGYRGVHQKHWRGIIILNEVKDGDFCIMPLTLDYLCRQYEGISLYAYMRKTYPKEGWGHLQT
tara:strand:- start:3377 stop:4198 length:822 start_codon:yes stop_codon:yes gene_type:complete